MIESCSLQDFTLCDPQVVRQHAQEWLAATTIARREELRKQTGVRYSPLHRLPYWDPVHHLVLGFMHNTLEGVLAHHCRVLWGVGRKKSKSKSAAEQDADYETDVGADSSEYDSEVEGLVLDATDLDENSDTEPSVRQRQRSDTLSEGEYMDVDDDSDDGDYVEPEFFAGCTFEPGQLDLLRLCIRNVLLPTWVSRPPYDFGSATHGTLKADRWLTMFTVILPMFLTELWSGDDASDYNQLMLDNFYDLVATTNIIASFSTSSSEADAYLAHYTAYRKALPTLFPHFHSHPNHHLAMHNSDLLKYWGPLAPLSEFAGERFNGMLQKIPTNRHTAVAVGWRPCFKIPPKAQSSSMHYYDPTLTTSVSRLVLHQMLGTTATFSPSSCRISTIGLC
ncbi:hypothetical protein AURDEDRAFT_121833 [Auricularia subglabra TFB-10046 SS5]|nr:hypothetical protein AURDEDRAFT_121833 [Auricularia subglabra TFB-10046 SS5]